jgi:hypothetical protein
LQLVATGKMQFLAVAVRFLTDFLFWKPVAVAVGPNMVKKPDPTGLSNTKHMSQACCQVKIESVRV